MLWLRYCLDRKGWRPISWGGGLSLFVTYPTCKFRLYTLCSISIHSSYLIPRASSQTLWQQSSAMWESSELKWSTCFVFLSWILENSPRVCSGSLWACYELGWHAALPQGSTPQKAKVWKKSAQDWRKFTLPHLTPSPLWVSLSDRLPQW